MAKYEICLAVGVLHPDHLDELLTARQMSGWIQFYRQRPFGERATDARESAWMALYYNSQLSKKDRHKVKRPDQMVPWPNPYKQIQREPAAKSAIMQQAMAAFAKAGIKRKG